MLSLALSAMLLVAITPTDAPPTRGLICLGDLDLDGQLDALDSLILLACLEGPDQPASLACTLADFDHDGHVDLRDAAILGSLLSNCLPASGECLTHEQCDDGIYCNGHESCSARTCVAGVPPCDAAFCTESDGYCTRSPCEESSEPFMDGVEAGLLPGSVADEASGLVASRHYPDVLWTHNDDAGDNRVFAIHATGQLLATYTVGTGSNDPEDIAIGPGPVPGLDYLYLADIGDNNSTRSYIFVKRFPEPFVPADSNPITGTAESVDILRFAYPTGPGAPSHKDAETLLLDPWNGDLYIVTKRTATGMVYRAAYPQATSGTTVLEHVATISWGWPVGGSVSPDGLNILIRRYSGTSPPASIWTRAPGEPLSAAFARPRCDVPLQAEPQGEAVAWDALGRGYYTISEDETPGALIPIWYFAANSN